MNEEFFRDQCNKLYTELMDLRDKHEELQHTSQAVLVVAVLGWVVVVLQAAGAV